MNMGVLTNFVRTFPEAKLTGSYYFGNATSTSDVDFFMAYDSGTLRKLTNLGFRQIPQDAYKDTFTKQVWAMQDIHVQLLDEANVGIKEKAQVFLAHMPAELCQVFLDLSKSKSKRENYIALSEIWNWAINTVRGAH